ncbi:DNA replication protein DnaC [Tahibacter aquaticus]|uniref:DNA replication protein DnaC n=1 Tax=Tahibacter aquaticus TaxID=520092 RepID=A0A4R6Z4D7_9GAMM|nr:ATP-binding protein [Tahibacter aquaticus]TDR46545.1 DNA replication protein DnaC [Tahibacter aquaticus]
MSALTWVDGLRGLKMRAMAERFARQEGSGDARAFVERLAEGVVAEAEARAQRAMERRCVQARVPSAVGPEDVRYAPGRGFLKRELQEFLDVRWVREHEHLVLTGASGRGKTFLASVLANLVLRAGLTVRFYDVPDLLGEWAAYDANGELPRFRRLLARTDLLVLDDWGHRDEPLDRKDVGVLRRVVLPALEKRSVLVVAKSPPEAWSDWLGGGDTAEELCDWFSRVPHRLDFKGPSMRERKQRK